jgi:hypothetical protein
MMILRVGGRKYFLSQDSREDELMRQLLGARTSCRETTINFSTAKVLVPNVPGCVFASTMGEDSPIDDWSDFELKLYRKLRRFPKHLTMLRGACLDRETMQPTGRIAVYRRPNDQGCGCELCRKGVAGMVMELVQQEHRQAKSTEPERRAASGLFCRNHMCLPVTCRLKSGEMHFPLHGEGSHAYLGLWESTRSPFCRRTRP